MQERPVTNLPHEVQPERDGLLSRRRRQNPEIGRLAVREDKCGRAEDAKSFFARYVIVPDLRQQLSVIEVGREACEIESSSRRSLLKGRPLSVVLLFLVLQGQELCVKSLEGLPALLSRCRGRMKTVPTTATAIGREIPYPHISVRRCVYFLQWEELPRHLDTVVAELATDLSEPD